MMEAQETNARPERSWFDRHFDTPRVRFLRRAAIFIVAGVFFHMTLIKPSCNLREIEGLRASASAFSKGQPHDAIGPLDKVDENHRWAFQPGKGFRPLREPEPGDWAYEFQEDPQTFRAYLDKGPNLVTPERDVLYLQPTGDFDPARAPDMEVLREFLEVYFQMETRLRPKMRGYSVTQRSDEKTGRTQLLVTEMLEAMKEDVPEDAYAVLALSTTDLYPDPSWGFVFGMASFSDRVGVYSVARFHEDFRKEGAKTPPEVLLRRTFSTMAHETGHMFSISHCKHFTCLVNGSNSLKESDRGTLHLCPVCLRKFYHASGGFDPAKRYEALHRFYKKHGLEDEAMWVKARIDARER